MPVIKADFSEIKARGAFSPKHVEEGDYRFTIVKSEVVAIKNGDNAGQDQAVFTLVSKQIRGATYPYYAPLGGKNAWKLRTIIEAAGLSTQGKTALSFNTDRLHGKEIGATLVDDEYQGRMKSTVDQIFPAGELNPNDTGSASVTEDEYEDEQEEAPRAKRTPSKKAVAAAVDPESNAADDLDLDDI
ncbi:MAG: hypothetical protein LC723_05295 [Actinobacteria bacterium]|nr:hypothetical protein [Actinomycetota bacterium]